MTAEDTTASGDLSEVAAYVSLQHPAEGLRASLVAELAEAGASALLVWPGRHGQEADLSDAVRAADAVGLPLLLLATHANFRRTSRLIATKVLAQSTHVLEYGTRVHRKLGDVFARGGGLPALAHTMSQLSGTTVLVMSSAGELLTSAAPSAPPRRASRHCRRRSSGPCAPPTTSGAGPTAARTTVAATTTPWPAS